MKNLMNETDKKQVEMDGYRSQMDKNAEAYMEKCDEFLKIQEEKFVKDLEERQKKIEIVSNIVNLGTIARVSNFKSQALKDTSLMKKAISTLDDVDPLLKDLRKITRDAEDLERIEKTSSAAKDYQGAMETYLKEYKTAGASRIASIRRDMDKSAASYVKQCKEFLTDQQAKLTLDMIERFKKTELVNNIIDEGNAIRVANFKSQATRDPELMERAEKLFETQLQENKRKLIPITHDAADLELIDRTVEVGKKLLSCHDQVS